MAQARFTSSGSNDISISQYAGQDYAKTTSEAGGLHEFHAEYQVPKDSWWKYRCASYSVVSCLTLLITQFSSQMLREAAAEFTGVMILTIFGNGAVCQTVLSSNPAVTPTPKGVRPLTGDASNSILIFT